MLRLRGVSSLEIRDTAEAACRDGSCERNTRQTPSDQFTIFSWGYADEVVGVEDVESWRAKLEPGDKTPHHPRNSASSDRETPMDESP